MSVVWVCLWLCWIIVSGASATILRGRLPWCARILFENNVWSFTRWEQMSLMYAWLVPSCSISEIALVSLSEPNLSSSSSFPKMRNTSISHFESQLEWKKRLDESWKLEAFFRDICQGSECSNRVPGWDKWKLDHSKNSGHLPRNDESPLRKK